MGDLGLPGLGRKVQDILDEHPVGRRVVRQILDLVGAAVGCSTALSLEITQVAAAGDLPAGARLARAVHIELQILLKILRFLPKQGYISQIKQEHEDM